MDCLILTCERDWALAHVAAAGLRKFWPGANPILLLDTDRSTETPLPDDIREMTGRIPYLRRVFDFPRLATTERFAIIDSDCLCYAHPTELDGLAFQGNPGGGDRVGGLVVWRRLGFELPHQDVRFVGGLFTATRQMYEDRELMYKYLRTCRELSYDRGDYPGVVCEQGLVSGLWRLTYPHNPLPPDKYPYQRFVPGCRIWHTSSFRTPEANRRIVEYARDIGFTWP